MKKKKKENKYLILVVLVIFFITFFISFKITKETKIINYNGLKFEKIKVNNQIYYRVNFDDLGEDEYTYYFYYNPYDLEKIDVPKKIVLKNETYIFADEFNECDNFYIQVISFSIFLFKIGTYPEVRDISESEKYLNKNSTIIFIRKINNALQKEEIKEEKSNYYIYVKDCDLEKLLERFLLKAYLDKKNEQ